MVARRVQHVQLCNMCREMYLGKHYDGAKILEDQAVCVVHVKPACN